MGTEGAIKLLAIGDTIFRTKNGGNPFEKIDHLFAEYDYVIVNLETAIIFRDKQYEVAGKSVVLSLFNDSLKWLEKYREKFIFTLSNNHIYDCGLEGYKDTIAFLKENNFIFVPHDSFLVLPDYSPKIRISAVFRSISNEYSNKILSCKESYCEDFLNILCIHWGHENVLMPSIKQINFADKLFENGIDVIVGHHSHTPQGRLVKGNKLCAFSLGNFNMSHVTGIPREMEKIGFMLAINVDSNKTIRNNIIPVYLGDDYSPELPDTQRYSGLASELDSLVSNISGLKKGIYFLSYHAHISKNYIFDSFRHGWIPRIKRYGREHFCQMLRWVFSRGFLIPLIFLPFNSLSRATVLMKKINKGHD